MKRWSTRAAKFVSLQRSLLLVTATAYIFLNIIVSVGADSIVRGFKASDSLQPGLIVALSSVGSDSVESAPANNPSRIYGVVVDPSQAPLTIQQKNQGVFVATSGSYPVLVDTQNGAIKSGDYISISSINGIGAKATALQSNVLGKAQESFDGQHNVITTDSAGTSIGRIAIDIVPAKNPLIKTKDISVPAPLKRISNSLAGKDVQPLRIYAALAVFIISALVAVSILWSGINSGMIAIGRNPLSRKSILQSLLQVVATALLILIIGMIGVYLLLRL